MCCRLPVFPGVHVPDWPAPDECSSPPHLPRAHHLHPAHLRRYRCRLRAPVWAPHLAGAICRPVCHGPQSRCFSRHSHPSGSPHRLCSSSDCVDTYRGDSRPRSAVRICDSQVPQGWYNTGNKFSWGPPHDLVYRLLHWAVCAYGVYSWTFRGCPLATAVLVFMDNTGLLALLFPSRHRRSVEDYWTRIRPQTRWGSLFVLVWYIWFILKYFILIATEGWRW